MRSSQSDLCDLECPTSCNHAVVLGRCEDVDQVELEEPVEVEEAVELEELVEVPVELTEDPKQAPYLDTGHFDLLRNSPQRLRPDH